MYSEKFEKALKFVLDREGGYSNQKNDFGGETKFGITSDTYLSWQRKVKGKTGFYKGIKDISLNEVKDIYWDFYWGESKAEDYSYPLALVVFDSSVNFGVGGCIQFLQECFGMKMTGIWDKQLEAKMEENDTVAFALKIIEGRIKYRYFRCQEDPSQEKFKGGWISRDNILKHEVLKHSKAQMDVTKIQAIETMSNVKRSLIDEVIKKASSYIPSDGRSLEIGGNNWGGDVTKFLASVGIDFPAPWCNAFTSYCVKSVLDKINYPEAIRMTADTWTTDTWGREKRIMEYEPQRGDLALFYWGATMPFHIGIVLDVDTSSNTFTSIEGNTNAQGSSEGNTVAKKIRNIADCKFVRWINLVSGSSVSAGKSHHYYDGVIIKGVTYASIRSISELLGYTVEYKDGIVEVNGKPIEVSFLVDNTSWGKLRDFVNRGLLYDKKSNSVTIGEK